MAHITFLISVDELDKQLSNWLSKVQRVDGPVRALIAPYVFKQQTRYS